MIRYSAVKQTSVVMELAKQIMFRFKAEFGHIDINHIQFAWRISDRSRYHGRTKLIMGEDRMFTDKRIVMILWRRSWKEHKKAWRALLIYHELRHVFPPKKEGGDYRLIRHDVEDFSDMLVKYGVRWENADTFLLSLEKRGTKEES